MSKALFKYIASLSLPLVFTASVAAAQQPHTSANATQSLIPTTKPTLYWAKNSAPPFYQTDQDSLYRSYGDHMQRFLEERLPQYHHETLEMDLNELNKQWSEGKALCFSTMIYDELPHKEYLLSIPNSLYEPHGIIVRKDFKFRSQPFSSAVELSKLISDKRYTMGKIIKRSFGEIIDEILQNSSPKTKAKLVTEGETIAALEQLSSGDFDYLIEYRYVFDFFKKHSALGKNLEFLPIKEVKNSVILGSVGCTNNTWGAKVIEDINQAIRQVVHDKDYQKNLVRWLATPGTQTKYLELYHKHMLIPYQ